MLEAGSTAQHRAAKPVAVQLVADPSSDEVKLQLLVREGEAVAESSSDEEEDAAEAAQMSALLEQMTAAGSDGEQTDAGGIDNEVWLSQCILPNVSQLSPDPDHPPSAPHSAPTPTERQWHTLPKANMFSQGLGLSGRNFIS